MFVASIVKIKTINKDVLDSEWTLTSCALRLVFTCQQISMCASCMTNPKSVCNRNGKSECILVKIHALVFEGI